MKTEKKFGLLLAVSTIVGIVIGSGIFFKSDDVLMHINGNFKFGVLAWLCGGTAMVFGALTISSYASRISISNGIIDYFEFTFGKFGKKIGEFAGYITAWFMSILYFPALVAVLAWVSAQYTLVLLGKSNADNSQLTWILAIVYMISLVIIRILSRVISSYIQISATFLKLIPLFLVAVAGMYFGVKNQVSAEDLYTSVPVSVQGFSGAVIATAFAFDGWILATTINDEIKDPKKNLPKALFFGTVLILVIYIAYFSGIVMSTGAEEVIATQDESVKIAVTGLFGQNAGTILIVFVVISCLGTLNGLIMTGSRMYYQIALRGHGVFPKHVSKINDKTNSPLISIMICLGISLVMLAIWYNNFNEVVNISGLLGTSFVDITSLPIVLNYIFLTVLYVAAMIMFKDDGLLKRFIIPVLAIAGSSVIIYGGVISPEIGIFIIFSLLIIVLGIPFFNWKK